MTLSLVPAGNDGFRPLSLADVRELQANQFNHDEANHREIARLPVQKRLTHMTLHFAKYVGRLFEGADDQQTLVDVFIIALSSANILGVHVNPIEGLQTEDGRGDRDRLITSLAREAGRMAAACEKLDHLEDYPFRLTLADAVKNISASSQIYAAKMEWNLKELTCARLAGVRQKVFKPGG